MDIWKVAGEIERLQIEAQELPETDDNAERRASLWAEERRLEALLQKEFGVLHGWRIARCVFTLDQLAQNRKVPNREEGRDFGSLGQMVSPCHIDWPSFYTLRGSPVAITAQYYDATVHRKRLDAECKKRRLVWQEVTDFPSWHYPGRTTLILITRPRTAKAMQAKA